MKIDSIMQGKIQTTDNMNTAKGHETSARIAGETFGYTLDITSKDKDITAFGTEKLDSFEDVKNKASVKNVALESDANAVMSNSMSKEDFAEYIKEGYSPSNMEIEDVVTSLDKIKATLLESGVVVKGYTDTVSDKELAKIAGSEALAGVIKDALNEENVPVTEDNVQAISDLINISKEVTEPTADSVKYMINNGLDVTVENFYKAEFSSSIDTGKRAAFYIDNTGYASIKPTESDFNEFRPQVEKIIENAGLEVNEKTLNDAKWLLDKDIPITGDNIIKLQDINSISFPIAEEKVAKTSAIAIKDGYRVEDADLTKEESYFSKAIKTVDEIDSRINEYSSLVDPNKLSKEEVRERRLLEEARLHMSADANIHLLKKGISIDTKDLESLVENLKQAEKEIYKPVLTEKDEEISEDTLLERIETYKETRNVLENIKNVPLETGAKVFFENRDFSLRSINNEGEKLKASYIQASNKYEELMTAPRKDLGDSIKKAFSNVDDILEDLDIEVNRINEKAVRSLGYAGLEINEKNIEELSKANTAVENVISLMNPKKTLDMIRKGQNPLDEDIFELEKRLSLEKNDEEEITNEKYNEFLVRLEKNNEITPDERASFIGFFRLFRKIEKSDGRLEGNVIGASEKLTLNNLLSASRSNRAGAMDIKIDDDYGALEKLVSYGKSITDQILQGFKLDLDTYYKDDYVDEEYQNVKEALQTEDAIKDALEKADEPVTVNNILAMDQLINGKGSLFAKLADKDEKNKIKEKINKLHDNFMSKEDADDSYDELIKAADELTKESIESVSNSIDLKELNSINKQLTIASSLVKNNSYEIPVEIDGEITKINLKLIKNTDETGKVTASFETEKYGKVVAEFKVSGNKATGFVISDKNEVNNIYRDSSRNNEEISGIEALKEKEVELKEKIKSIGIDLDTIYYTNKADINNSDIYNSESSVNTPTSDLYNLAKAFINVMKD